MSPSPYPPSPSVTWAVVLAAGSGSRMVRATGGVAKQFLELDGLPLYFHSVRTFAAMPAVAGVVVVFPPALRADAEARAQELVTAHCTGFAVHFASGGARRQDSVRSGLDALPPSATHVLVHDGARPFFGAPLAARVIEATLAHGAAIPAIPVADTIKEVDDHTVVATPAREHLRAVQTPQGVSVALARKAHDFCEAHGVDVTDDASMVEALGSAVAVVAGDAANVKLTTPEDLRLLAPAEACMQIPVTGQGYDVHRYVEAGDAKARPMLLGTVAIPNAPCVSAHSDGDVLLHALADALLGLCGGGDIGELFPDTDPQCEAMDSAVIVDVCLQRAREAGVRLTHVDVTIICQTPRVGVHKRAIGDALAMLLQLDRARVNVKATTEEGLGFTGQKQGIKAMALVSGLMSGPLSGSLSGSLSGPLS